MYATIFLLDLRMSCEENKTGSHYARACARPFRPHAKITGNQKSTKVNSINILQLSRAIRDKHAQEC